MNKTMFLVLVTAMVTPLAFAGHTPVGRCDSNGNVALGVVEIGSGDGTAAVYVDDRNYALGNGVWLYAETNGIYTAGGAADHNLQRGGSSPVVPDDNEICVDDALVTPDVLIF